jgi:hypothetical protein
VRGSDVKKLEIRKKIQKEKASSNRVVSQNIIDMVDVSADLLKSDGEIDTVGKKQKIRSNSPSDNRNIKVQKKQKTQSDSTSDNEDINVRKKQKKTSNSQSGSWTVSSRTTESDTELMTQSKQRKKKGRKLTTKGIKSDNSNPTKGDKSDNSNPTKGDKSDNSNLTKGDKSDKTIASGIATKTAKKRKMENKNKNGECITCGEKMFK